LSARGLMALDSANIKEEILETCIPMRGREIHPVGEGTFFSAYSGREQDYINSVSRPGLNITLLNEASKFKNIEIRFDSKVSKIDLENASIEYVKNNKVEKDQGDVVIGTDGAGSVVRRSLMGKTTKLLFNYSQDFLRHGYKELSIHPGENGSWKIKKEALHIWPRGHFMIIALPNLDGSFTLTMFHPFEGEAGFNTLNTEEKLTAFFEKYYPTLLPYIPHYVEEYFENPVGTLGTIKCYPWQAYGKTLIMGDASHAIVPFYGQGMNSSLEDVRIFMDIVDKYGTDWEKVFTEFQDERKVNADAIADLAIDNFHEMIDHVDDMDFKRKRNIETQLEQEYEDYYSKYSLVTFRPELPYSEAKRQGRKKNEILLEMCRREDFDSIPLVDFYNAVKNV